MKRLATLELPRNELNFCAAHFTIFSATHRENLHGHNYEVQVNLTFSVSEEGLNFDYREYKEKIKAICKSLNQLLLLPEKSPYLKIESEDKNYKVYFADEVLYFLKRDVRILPVTNITLEELSYWILQELLKEKLSLQAHQVSEVAVKVFSSAYQAGEALVVF